MFEFRKHFDTGSLIVIIVTFVLFVTALFTKGFTHDLLLEAGVFLVSLKLIMMSYKNGDAIGSVQKKLGDILSKLDDID